MVAGIGAGVAACGLFGGGGESPAPAEAEATPAQAVRPALPAEPVPTLLVVQAHFDTSGPRPKPLPAKLSLLHKVGNGFVRSDVLDPESNVFHKAIAWRGGILTIGAEKAPKPATLKHWTRGADGAWNATTLWSQGWEGAQFNRFRDLEIGDVTGDGRENLVVATHDRGVVAIGEEVDGAWRFTQLGEAPDTFVHEIELGDVDGDGVQEIYATPSERNKASGVSQPGEVVRVDKTASGWAWTVVATFAESHAKEILVTDLDADGRDELYIVREGHVVKEGGVARRVDPVRIVRAVPGGSPTALGPLLDTTGATVGERVRQDWALTTVATLDDDQCRFILPADLDGDGTAELVAAGFKSGLWRLDRGADGQFAATQIDADSGGFEHATHAADLDGDGRPELYVAADTQGAFRRYVWVDGAFQRTELLPIGPSGASHITWNIQDGVF